MKKLFFILAAMCMAASVWAGEVTIDKENCTITKDGKTFPLYGKVKIVDSFEDIKVKIVDAFEDTCGKVKIVEHFEDVKVKIVDSFEGINR